MRGDDRTDGFPIDLDHLSEQTFGNAELEAEVLRLFLKQGRECLDRLDASPDAGTAHLLVGSARGIGARAVAAAASALEAALLAGRNGAAERQRLGETLAVAGAFIEARLGGRG
jgi:HPt (histidine-containing phosphotransfer) domain-containing protein